MLLIAFFITTLSGYKLSAQELTIHGLVHSSERRSLADVNINLDQHQGSTTREDGSFRIVIPEYVPDGTELVLKFTSVGYATRTIAISTDQIIRTSAGNFVCELGEIVLNESFIPLREISILGNASGMSGRMFPLPVGNDAILAGRKAEVIKPGPAAANTATNNPRQIFSHSAGMNIWENDGSGTQLNIASRGLSPNRSWEFNTRQNGADVSADIFGYPEAYYTPPMDAVDRIVITRGASSLQYGPQFGGLIDFKMKRGDSGTPFKTEVRQTFGTGAMFNSYNSVGGTVGDLNYYGFFHYKSMRGSRPHSDLQLRTGYLSASYALTDKLALNADVTAMGYLQKQPGGLTDSAFAVTSLASGRSRNWFHILWHIPAVTISYTHSRSFFVATRFFGLLGERYSVGYLGAANLADPLGARTVATDDYLNGGTETRFLIQNIIFDIPSVTAAGFRYFRGSTGRAQGAGSSGANADFSFAGGKPDALDFDFATTNYAFFAENMFLLTDRLSITPGYRYEYLLSDARGSATSQSVPLPQENRSRRIIQLFGVGSQYELSNSLQMYANITQAYRPILYSDLISTNPLIEVDPALRDASGFSADIGIRGATADQFMTDFSLYYMAYGNKIGVISQTRGTQTIQYRTNISDAVSYGAEASSEIALLQLSGAGKEGIVSLFSAFAWNNAYYLKSQNSAVEGKQVEYSPKYIVKTGLKGSYGSYSVSLLHTYVDRQFSDATNTISTPSGINGIIPAYRVIDLNLTASFHPFLASLNVNNLLNELYFTRRASGYPGPGIIPAEPRNIHLTVGLEI